MKKSGNKLDATSTGYLKTGPDKGDESPGKRPPPINRGQKDVKQKSPMRKGK